MATGTIPVQVNYLGTPLKKEDIALLTDGSKHPRLDIDRSVITLFFGMDLQSLPSGTLERYSEISTTELYLPITPHGTKIFERLIDPLKSAKRCYCLGEYLATIEISAHIGEMMAILVWNMTPVSYQGAEVGAEFEKSVLGDTFEKHGQGRRVKILKGLKMITEDQEELFSRLRGKRKNYFHIWSSSMDNAKADASDCFITALKLTKDIMQLEESKKEKGKITVNPLLLKYIQEVDKPSFLTEK